MRGNMEEPGAQLAAAIQGRRRPCALIDLDAFDRNLERLMAPLRGTGKTLRVASKSLRVPALVQRVASRPGARGVMCHHVREAAQLAAAGMDDLLVAYPAAPEEHDVFAALVAEGTRVWATVDGVDPARSASAAAVRAGVELELCLDLDLSLAVGPLLLGVRRSPLRSVEQAVALARAIDGLPGVRLSAVLGYEAQIAGVQDRTGSAKDLAVRALKARSRPMVLARRAAVVEALRRDGHGIEVVNGGGTGSVAFTAGDPSVTEVSAGSGLFCPHLFDGYAGLALEPAAFFALAVVRCSDPGFFTCYGGGYIASGAVGADRWPRPWWPTGLRTVELEGFGEVQTPFRGDLRYGDTVLCRHAKAGELADRFDTVLLVAEGEVVDEVPTMRGLSTLR